MTKNKSVRTVDHAKKRIYKLISSVIVYMLLVEFVFVFIYPFLHMVINSFKFDTDFRDLNRQWILSGFNFGNYTQAIKLLKYTSSVVTNITIVIIATVGHVLSCSFIAYGVSRFNFKGRGIVFALIILSIIIPPQILMMPLYIQFANLGWLGSVLPIIVPSFFGFGLSGGVFIYIFMQFFKGLPKSYEEAAKIEGCGGLNVFFRIMLPLSKTAILVVATLSTVWHWNDAFEPSVYLNGATKTLNQMLDAMPQYLYQTTTATGTVISPVALAGCALIIGPILILFFFTQKYFAQGIEFSGLAN